jgi:ferredoxin
VSEERAAAPTIVVDRELCMGSGMCIVYAPATFAHDDETKAVVVDPEGDPIDAIRNAMQACPTSAIRIEEH